MISLLLLYGQGSFAQGPRAKKAASAKVVRVSGAQAWECAACHRAQNVLPKQHVDIQEMPYVGCVVCHLSEEGFAGALKGKMPGSHLHAFRIEDDAYEAVYPDDWAQDFAGPGQRRDEKKFRLCDLLHAPGDWLIYEYDFGDSWQHEVVVEKVLPTAEARHAVCLAGARAGPPEDCGSVPGYENLVAAMANPNHPERAELLEAIKET